jgi:hypothetical protein
VQALSIVPGTVQTERVSIAAANCWYDLMLEADGRHWQFAGHVETGSGSISDPAIEQAASALHGAGTTVS